VEYTNCTSTRHIGGLTAPLHSEVLGESGIGLVLSCKVNVLGLCCELEQDAPVSLSAGPATLGNHPVASDINAGFGGAVIKSVPLPTIFRRGF
jgi:hypothetical protein